MPAVIELVLNCPTENCDPLIVLTFKELMFAVHAPIELAVIVLVVNTVFAMKLVVNELTVRVLKDPVIPVNRFVASELTCRELTESASIFPAVKLLTESELIDPS